MTDTSFFDYFYKKTGGLHDPLLVNKVIDALKEWLPEKVELRGTMDTYASGWNAYRNQIMENLK